MQTELKHHINYYRVAEAIDYLQNHVQRQPELDEVADRVHLSPFHFQKIFSEWAGISPKRFLQFLTVEFLKERLHDTHNLTAAAEQAGLSSQSRVYDLFTTLEGVTPQEYRLNGKGTVIRYGVQPTRFGKCLIGITERGICWLSFLGANASDEEEAIVEMKRHWDCSEFLLDKKLAGEYVSKIFDQASSHDKLHLLVKGTNFQVKVWNALLNLPHGSVTTYQHIAHSVGQPAALQAVGSAVGSNAIAYLIPCHRVIRKNGVFGEYRWGQERKKLMIGWEFARQRNSIPA